MVDEEVKKEEVKEPLVPEAEPPKEESGQIAEAKALVEELKRQNKILEENLRKAERISTESILSGRSLAGSEITKEDLEVAEARKILAGTGYDDLLFPKKK
jgi:hypothetical protein